MNGVAFANVFNTKIVKYETKNNGTPFMAPEACGGATLVVAVLLEALFEEYIGKYARLWEAVNNVADFKVNPTAAVDLVQKIVLFDEIFGYVAQFDADIFRAVQQGLEVEGFNIKCDKLCALLGNDAVEDKIYQIDRGSLGAVIARIGDILACYGDASVAGI